MTATGTKWRFWLFLYASLTVLASGSVAVAAVKPKPWQWTPTQASGQILAWNPAAFPDRYGSTEGRLTSARCSGRGAAVARRFVSFRCAVVYQSRRAEITTAVLWVKVRRQGAGQPCVSRDSLPAIEAACLNPVGVRVKGSTSDAWTAVRLELARQQGTSFPYQGPGGCLGFGAGFYRCWFGSNYLAATNGQASVVMFAAGPRVSVLSMPTG